jgi:hypothetical protein
MTSKPRILQPFKTSPLPTLERLWHVHLRVLSSPMAAELLQKASESSEDAITGSLSFSRGKKQRKASDKLLESKSWP